MRQNCAIDLLFVAYYTSKWKLNRYPTCKLKCYIFMSIRTSITPRLCNQTNCIGGIYPFFRRKSKSIKTCLFFKPLEFEGFKKGLYKPSQIPKYSTCPKTGWQNEPKHSKEWSTKIVKPHYDHHRQKACRQQRCGLHAFSVRPFISPTKVGRDFCSTGSLLPSPLPFLLIWFRGTGGSRSLHHPHPRMEKESNYTHFSINTKVMKPRRRA